MGMFDDSLKSAVPGGDLIKPIAIAAGALILSKWLGGGHSDPAPSGQIMPPKQAPASPPAGGVSASDDGLAGGLGGLIDKLTKGGLGQAANSWVSSGPNQPVTPGQLGSALGQQTISDIAQRAGVSEQDLLNMLAQALPQIVDGLTPNGRVPTQSEVNAYRR
jgi:uncharacterized protein YidB (DUF937 family)